MHPRWLLLLLLLLRGRLLAAAALPGSEARRVAHAAAAGAAGAAGPKMLVGKWWWCRDGMPSFFAVAEPMHAAAASRPNDGSRLRAARAVRSQPVACLCVLAVALNYLSAGRPVQCRTTTMTTTRGSR